MAEKNVDNAPVVIKNPELIGRMLDNQSRELELRAQELALRKDVEKHNFDFAKESLKAKQADRIQAREQWKAALIIKGCLALAFVSVVLSFCAWAISRDKEVIVMEICKACLYFGAGAFSSYGVGKYRGRKEQQEHDSNQEE